MTDTPQKIIIRYEAPELAPWVHIFQAVSQRGAIGIQNGIRFVIHTAEQGHSKPHLHARYQSDEISLEIPSGKVLCGSLPPKQTKRAKEWLQDNLDYVYKKWDELADGVTMIV